ncbi:NKG2-A/NKG2-B type II integral membrane protein-like isoform X1 [Phyllostomus hastatus]|uniref:NKG2-A/NKG2-B type II integral membrane protein-like isoform X1 n=1 Tax=Phyllostomus hastatus TaxID=9423 RepID=UPI001E68297B|nr:NKG2-A/NKG2-B type II integral membrane protein-like isoform X1 [Phyllostomus hastatus]
MDLQWENHSELSLAKDSRRQQRKGKNMKSSVFQTKQHVSSVEIEFQNASQDLQGNDKNHCTDSLSPPEKLIAGILGVICLILYILVRMALWSQIVTAENRTGNQTTGNQKAYHCGRCPPEWLMYSNNCYYISTEGKTWNESLIACASKNSNLLYIDNEEEMNFLNIFEIVPWIGLFQRNNTNSWVWTIGTTLSSDLFAKTSKLDKNCVFWNYETHKFYSKSCLEKRTCICKHQSH